MFIEQNHGLDGAQGQQVKESFLPPFEGLPVHWEVCYHLIALIYPRHVLDAVNHCFWLILFITPTGVLQLRGVHHGQHENLLVPPLQSHDLAPPAVVHLSPVKGLVAEISRHLLAVFPNSPTHCCSEPLRSAFLGSG